MMGRVDQQLRVTRLMIDAHDLRKLQKEQPRLGRYMTSYLAMMMTISSIFLIMEGSEESLRKKDELWEYLKARDWKLCHQLKYRSLAFVGNLPGKGGRDLALKLYRIAQKIYKFN